MKTRTILLATCLITLSTWVGAEEIPAPPAEVTPEPEAVTFTSQHEIQIDGQRLKYAAKAGTLIMRDEEGKAIAEFGYTAYFKNEADPVTRPIMFAWNGGPGSASMWLHMGVLGPQRTAV